MKKNQKLIWEDWDSVDYGLELLASKRGLGGLELCRPFCDYGSGEIRTFVVKAIFGGDGLTQHKLWAETALRG